MLARIKLDLLLSISLLSFASIVFETRAYDQSQREDGNKKQGPRYNAPFLVLMSANEIAVAQLPLIDNGNVSVVYQLVEPSLVAVAADTREYEQMPRSTVLGKSEWQQIASTKPVRTPRSQEVGERRDEDADEQQLEGRHETRRSRRSTRRRGRIRRSSDGNSLTDAGKNATTTSVGTGNVVLESYLNVTSGPSSLGAINSEPEERGGAPAEEADDDKNSVQFRDFDAHMALGYVFATDSLGRIHRFRLSGYERENSNENWMENDYTNTIDAASSLSTRDFSSPSSTLSFDAQRSRQSVTKSDVPPGSDDGAGSGEGSSDDDANKVSQNDVTHEQSGRHPTTSEMANLAALLKARSDAMSDAPTSDSQLSATSSNNQRQEQVFNASKPRIIWSRNKHSTIAHLASESSHYQRAPSSAVKGAFPSQSGDDVGVSNDSDTQHMADDDSNESEQTANQFEDQLENPKSRLGIKLPTEIAVDWLNNLLFVLDKYRLSVVDFDGNNELVIIDDFNVNNRPVDIKIDPVNDFLFWLQVGKFHNTIYKLDLSVLSQPTTADRLIANTLKLNQNKPTSTGDASDLVALISHHYAHPIITNLPKHVKIFTIDHKHSRIYVPSTISPGSAGQDDKNIPHDNSQVEVFNLSDGQNVPVTHMNNTFDSFDDGKNCNTTFSNSDRGQILAYNLDGTDVGPLRDVSQRGHLSSLTDIQDLTFDSQKGFLYWLTNEGREIFEEYKTERDSSFYSAQHNLEGKRYLKLLHFNNGSNQSSHRRPRFNLRKLIHILATTSLANRWTRSDSGQFEENNLPSSLNSRQLPSSDSTTLNLSHNAPYMIVGIVCLAFLSIYLIYMFVFQQSNTQFDGSNPSGGGSIAGSSISESHCEVNTDSFIPSSVTRWVVRPSTQSTDASTFNRGIVANEHSDSIDIESTNYNTSNAVDEHYRDMLNNQTLFNLDDRLANLNEWPTNMHDMSNKLYIPVEVLHDETLSSIHRISIDQLEIDKRSPLGKGNFGTVLQGTITYSSKHGDQLPNNSQFIPVNITGPHSMTPPAVMIPQRRDQIQSYTSSGHGSSSTSSEFVTVDASQGEYLTPKSCYDISLSECANSNSSRPDSYSEYNNANLKNIKEQDLNNTPLEVKKLKVAIKRLKDDASAEEKRDFLQEAKLLASFNHDNIVHLIGICLDRGSTLIVMELMLGGDLIRYMQENIPNQSNTDKLTLDDLLAICLDIVNGCCYLEELNYIHRDLAARNCLVSSRKKEERVVKLADFGLARDIYKDSYYKKLNDSAMPLKWMAPECLIEQKFTSMSDVWSFGVVMWEILSYCQEKPYANLEPFLMKDYLTNGARLKKPENCSDDIYRLMNECWQLEPRNRPTFQECRAILIEIKSNT